MMNVIIFFFLKNENVTIHNPHNKIWMGYHVYVETFNYICNSILRNPTLNFGIHFIFKSQEREFECGTAGQPTDKFPSLPTRNLMTRNLGVIAVARTIARLQLK